MPGCTEVGTLKQCSACHMVQYCGSAHQKANWAKHKKDCVVFTRLGLRALFYNDEDMLRAYPLSPRVPTTNAECEALVAAAQKCPLCGKSSKQTGMTLTRCCFQPVCDSEDEYQLMSFSREFCPRSHSRYTLCGQHGVEPDCDAAADWRECKYCIGSITSGFSGTADALWRGLNSYNFTPLLADTVPRNALCDVCTVCKKNFMSGLEGCSYAIELTGSGIKCLGC